jgi:hypothetical protein
MCMFHSPILPFSHSDLNLRFPSQMPPGKAELKSSSISWVFIFHLFQFFLPLQIVPLPRSRTSRLRAARRSHEPCAVCHMPCAVCRVLVAPAPIPLLFSYPPSFVFSHGLLPLSFTHPAHGREFICGSLASQHVCARFQVSIVPDYLQLPSLPSQFGHQWTSHSFNSSYAVRDQTCKTSGSRVRSSMQGSTQMCSGNLKINSSAKGNPSLRCVATTPWNPGSELINAITQVSL